MSGINSSSSSNSSFISDSSSPSLNTTNTINPLANPTVQIQPAATPSILNLLNFSRQFTNSTNLLNSLSSNPLSPSVQGAPFPFYLFPQFQATQEQLQATVSGNLLKASFNPGNLQSVKRDSSTTLSEDLIKQHLSQLIKKQEKRSSEDDMANSDIDKNMIYE